MSRHACQLYAPCLMCRRVFRLSYTYEDGMWWEHTACEQCQAREWGSWGRYVGRYPVVEAIASCNP